MEWEFTFAAKIEETLIINTIIELSIPQIKSFKKVAALQQSM